MAARTPPVRVMPNGTRDKRTTTVSERGQRYMDRYGMRPWHKRKARNANRGQIAAQPGPQDEEINATDSIPDLQPMPYLDEDESANNHLSNLFSSPPVANAPPFREANLATQTANEVAPENIYSPGYPVEFAPQNIYPPNGNIYSPGYPFEFAPRSVSPLNADTDFSGDPFGYAPQNIFNDYINDDFWNVENFSPFSLGF